MQGLLKTLAGRLHHRLFRARFAWRSRPWQIAGDRPRPPLKRILVSGYLNEPLGIGEAGRLTVRGLEAAGIDVVTEDLRPFDRGLLTRPPASFDTANADVWLIHANPPEARIALFTHDQSIWQPMYRIGYWVWETSRAPADWADMARWFHEIWTPSEFSRNAIAACLSQPDIGKLRVMPHPVRLPPVAANTSDTDFTALVMFDPRSSFERKNPMGAVEAWLKAFPEPVQTARLIVKTYGDAPTYPAFRGLEARVHGRPDIRIRAETLDEPASHALIAGSDLVISLHRGEGFGLILAESMAAGVCVMATGWSGNLDFMSEDNSVLVPCHLVPAPAAYNGPDAQWAEPDIAFAAAAIRDLFDHAGKRRRLASAGRQTLSGLVTPWLAMGPRA